MSSFFTIPGAQQKRKRPVAPETSKKRLAGPRVNGNFVAKKVTAPPRPPKRHQQQPGPRRRTAEEDSENDDDDSISGSDLVSGEEGDASSKSDETESEEERETAADTRRRLAEQYIENVKEQVDSTGFDAADLDRDLIAERLQEDVAESKGKVYRYLAGDLDLAKASHCIFTTDNMPTTSVAACAPYVYTTTKDMYLQKWKIQDLPQDQWPQTTRKKPKKPPAPPRKKPELERYRRGLLRRKKDKDYRGHVGPILCVAVSGDGKFVATGGEDKRLIIHDGDDLRALKVFGHHHRDAVTGLAFRRGTHQLYSCSRDRTVKVWSLDDMAYVETLFGHQDDVVDIDALAQERCVSVGARDRTARLWKVMEETQLVFRGGGGVGGDGKKLAAASRPGVDLTKTHPESLVHEGSMDRVAMVDDELFVTGSDNGSLCLWSLNKKKPVHVVPLAHGLGPPLDPASYTAEKQQQQSSKTASNAMPQPAPRWITALRTLPYSDLILSGSWDGYVRVWRLSEDRKRIEPVGTVGRRTTTTPRATGSSASAAAAADDDDDIEPEPIHGVVNGIALFERGTLGVDGLCVVAAIGKHHRFGTWEMAKGGKNGGIVFEIPRSKKEAAALPNGDTLGVNGVGQEEDGDSDG